MTCAHKVEHRTAEIEHPVQHCTADAFQACRGAVESSGMTCSPRIDKACRCNMPHFSTTVRKCQEQVTAVAKEIAKSMRSDLIEVAIAQLGYGICLPLWQRGLKADVATLQASQGQGDDHSAPLNSLACRSQLGAFSTRRSDEGQPQLAVSPSVSSSWYRKGAVQCSTKVSLGSALEVGVAVI